jgi:transcriptional regulator with XRE-family HTH domain
MTQAKLAEQSGVRQQHISMIELGKVNEPAWTTVQRLSKALRIRPEQLFPVNT